MRCIGLLLLRAARKVGQTFGFRGLSRFAKGRREPTNDDERSSVLPRAPRHDGYRSSSITSSSTARDGRTFDSGSVAMGSAGRFSRSRKVGLPVLT